MPSWDRSQSPFSAWIRQALYLPLGFAAVYLAFFVALLHPFFQRHFIFLHSIQFPFRPSYSQPHKYGLAPFKTRAITLNTNDGELIGAWHVLPEIAYQAHLNSQNEWRDEVYEQAMRQYPTILYLHGNSMNRAAPWRIAAYSALTSRLDANVVAIDYRGFGDSTGTPSEPGLVEDAETAYRWIRSQQQPRGLNKLNNAAENGEAAVPSITVFGQSLGTGIAALLAATLERQGTPADGIVLMAPYTDLKSLVKDFRLGGLLPLLAPIDAIPFNNYILDTFLQTHLSTLTTLPSLTSASSSGHTSMVLLHAKDDPVIPIAHSYRLFDALLSKAGPATRVHQRNIGTYAQVKRFDLALHDGPDSQEKKEGPVGGARKRGQVTLIETEFGGHNQLTEGALDLVRLALKLPSHLPLQS